MSVDINMSRKSNAGGMQHDQIIHFINGSKRLIQGVVYIWENEMTHIIDYLGVEYIVNKSNVLFVERFSKGGEGNVKNEPGTGRKAVVGSSSSDRGGRRRS